MYFIVLLWSFCQVPQIKKIRIIYRGYAELTVMYSSCHCECWSAQLSIRHCHSLAEYNLCFLLPLDLTEVGKQARCLGNHASFFKFEEQMNPPHVFTRCFCSFSGWTGSPALQGKHHWMLSPLLGFCNLFLRVTICHSLVICLQSPVVFSLTQYVSEECRDTQCASLCIIPAKSSVFHALVCF